MRSYKRPLYTSIIIFALLGASFASDNLSRKRKFDGIIDTSSSNKNDDQSRKLIIPCHVKEIKSRVLTPHPQHSKPTFSSSTTFNPIASNKSDSNLVRLSLRRTSSLDEADYNDVDFVNEDDRIWRRELLSAIQADDKLRLMDLTSENINTDFRIFSSVDSKTYTYPIHFALHHHLNSAAQFLIDETTFGADLIDSLGHTPLSLTIELGKYQLFRVLLEHSDLNILVRDGLYVTHLAASSNSLSVSFLEGLKDHKADFTLVCSKRGWNPLQYAVAAGNSIFADWINTNTTCNVNAKCNESIVLFALKEDQLDLASSLISWDANVIAEDKDKCNIIHLLAKNGSPQKILLQTFKVSDENRRKLSNSKSISKGYLPVHYAAEVDNIEMIQYFADHLRLFDKTDGGKSIIEVAIDSGSIKTVEYMFSHNLIDLCDCFSESNPPVLVNAYKDGKEAIVKVLLDHLSEIYYYAFDNHGLNILHHAVIKNDLDFIKILLEQHAFDPNCLDNEFEDDFPANSPLSWAIFCNFQPIVEYLLKKGARKEEMVKLSLFTPEDYDPDLDEGGIDLVELAGIFGGEDMVKLLSSSNQIILE